MKVIKSLEHVRRYFCFERPLKQGDLFMFDWFETLYLVVETAPIKGLDMEYHIVFCLGENRKRKTAVHSNDGYFLFGSL